MGNAVKEKNPQSGNSCGQIKIYTSPIMGGSGGNVKMPENKNTEMLRFDNTATTQLITLDKYDYDRLRENTAKLKAIENLAIEDEVVNGDVILAICGVLRKEVCTFKK